MDITITLGAAEIDEAIKEYISAKSPMVEVDNELTIEFIAGKGSAGHAAIVKILGDTPVAPPKKVVKKKAAPKTDPAKDVTPETLPEKKPKKEEVKAEPKKVKVEEDPFGAQDNAPEVSEGLKEAMKEPAGEAVFGDMPSNVTEGADNIDALFG